MAEVEQVVERTLVTRLRVSHVAARIHHGLHEVGNPDTFEALVQTPTSVRGLHLGLPYVDAELTPVDIAFWSMIAEIHLMGPVSRPGARKLRREAVPLRLGAALSVSAASHPPASSYLDLHVHPFGAVGISTFDLKWDDPEPMENIWLKVAEIERQSAVVGLPDWSQSTTLSAAADVAAGRVVDVLTEPGTSHSQVLDYRVTTVIEGLIEPIPNVMPPDGSALHAALHSLCRGSGPPALPDRAFVPAWSGADFRYWPRELVYMIDKGAAIWAAPNAHNPLSLTRGQQHRRLTLLLAHLTASVGLIDAAISSSSPGFAAWAMTAAQRMGRLYGPARPEHGIAPRRYLDQTGFRTTVETLLGTRLVANAAYHLTPYC